MPLHFYKFITIPGFIPVFLMIKYPLFFLRSGIFLGTKVDFTAHFLMVMLECQHQDFWHKKATVELEVDHIAEL